MPKTRSIQEKSTFILASLLASLLAAAGPISAAPVLVEFSAADGTSLVPSTEAKVGPFASSAEATGKRVSARASSISEARDDLVATLQPYLLASITGSYNNFPLLRMEVDEAGRSDLAMHPQVVAVYDDQMRIPLMESSLAFLDASDWHDSEYTGNNTAVAVLDTGIAYWNGFFGACDDVGEVGIPGCRVKVFEGFATLTFGTGSTDPVYVATNAPHGTNVGGIVSELAPGTDLLSLGVFAIYDPDSSTGFDGGTLANDGDVAEALDWCIDHKAEYNIVAANMSLGSSVDAAATGYCSGWMAGAYVTVFNAARDAGIVPVVATGNDYVKTAIAPPSCVSSAFAVAAGYDDPAYGYTCGTGPVIPGAVTCFSDTNSLVDIVAPGNDIDAGGLYGYSGTSMASPHGAGLVALYASRYGSSPIWTIERIRADAVPIEEIGPAQTYIHRSARVGDREAVMKFDSGAVLASNFSGMDIPDADPTGIEVTGTVVCDSALCLSDTVGNVYLDLDVVHQGTGDLVIELEGPDGTIVTHEFVDDDEVGVENVNSILGSQHLQGVFVALSGSSIEGEWKLRVRDDTSGRIGRLHQAVLLIDSARVEILGEIAAPDVARPDEPFPVDVTLLNRGNASVTVADLSLELVDAISGEVVDSGQILPDVPFAPESTRSHGLDLSGPQGNYTLRLTATALDPSLAPGLVAEEVPVAITYRTFASFTVAPAVPAPGMEASLLLTSRGIIDEAAWDFGDGTTSTLRDPTHSWEMPGDYVVTLPVAGPDGNATTARTVHVAEPIAPDFGAEGGGCACSVAAPGSPASVPWLALATGALLLTLLRVLRSRGSTLRHAPARQGTAPLPLAITVVGLLSPVMAALLASCAPSDISCGDACVEDAPATAPWISLLDPADPSMDDVPIHVMLSTREPSSCDVDLELSVADGDWTTLTLVDPAEAAGLESGPEGSEHDIVWRSTADIPGDVAEVRVRAVASCTDGDSLPVTSSPFDVTNFFVTNPHAVVITEISTAESGETSPPGEYRSDWVEILNTTSTDLSLDGWVILATTGGAVHDEFALDGITMEAGARIVLAEIDSPIEGAIILPDEIPWDTTASGAIAIIAEGGRGVDFVRWGGSSEIPPAGLSWTDDPPLPVPQTLTVLNRTDESSDTDRASDFCVAQPTPGWESVGCLRRTLPGEVLISELDSQGSNDQIEILNVSGDSVEIGGWVLLWDGDDLGSGSVALGGFGLEAGSRLVLRDNGTAGRVIGGTLMELGQNLNIDGLIPIAIALQNPYGDVIDFLAAGGSKIRWVDWTEDEPTPMPGPSTTLSRRPGEPDTNSAADFCLTTDNLGSAPTSCLEPIGAELVITEVMVGRPDWVENWNPGPGSVDLSRVFLSYSAPYYGGSVGDFLLSGTIAAGEFALIAERDVPGVTGEILTSDNMSLGSDGAGNVTLRDVYGFGIDFVMWGDPAGVPIWPDTWFGLGADVYPTDEDSICIQRHPHDAADTDSRDDWCWSTPTPLVANDLCL